jgi:hypothetical protein
MSTSLLAALRTPKPTITQRELIMDALGYEPWPEQADFHFDIDPDTGEERRHKLVTGGEQAGKSFSAAMEMMTKLFWGQLFWIVGPDYSQTRAEFNYLERWCTQLGLLTRSPNKPDKGAWRMDLITGATVVTKSAQDVATIAGAAPDGILFVEAGQAPYEAFLRCYGRTAPKRGWLCINGTFEKDTGSWLRNLWKAAQTRNSWRLKSFSLPSWANRTFYPGGRQDPEILALEAPLDPDHFNERFGGVPGTPKGLVHKEFDYTLHVKNVVRRGNTAMWERDPALQMFPDETTVMLPTDTVDEVWVDPGYQHSYAVLFVSVFQGIAVVYDELCEKGRATEQMIELALVHPRWQHVQRIVLDISGQHHQGGNKAAAESWYEKTRLRPQSRLVKIQDGIERLRISLTPNPETGTPGIFFDPDCKKTCWELAEGYKYRQDRWGEPIPNEDPEDINNDSVKALVYGLTLNFGRVRRTHERQARLRDKTGGGRTVGGWELLYDTDPSTYQDPSDFPVEGDYDYDASYEEEVA